MASPSPLKCTIVPRRAHHAMSDGMPSPRPAHCNAAPDVRDYRRTGPIAAHANFNGVPAVTHCARNDPGDIPISWIRWKGMGHVSRDETGDLVFPLAPREPGIYRFLIQDGTGVVAGYIGQAAKSLSERFSLYRTRGRTPSYPLERKQRVETRSASLLNSRRAMPFPSLWSMIRLPVLTGETWYSISLTRSSCPALNDG